VFTSRLENPKTDAHSNTHNTSSPSTALHVHTTTNEHKGVNSHVWALALLYDRIDDLGDRELDLKFGYKKRNTLTQTKERI